jgi:hypothetical protein
VRADVPALQPLVRAYDSGLEVPLTAAEREAQDTARAHARARFPAIMCALQLIAGIPAWTRMRGWATATRCQRSAIGPGHLAGLCCERFIRSQKES